MTKVDDAKIIILNAILEKEYVIGAEFDSSVCDEKPLGYKFYRINIFYRNADGEATFGAKGVYIKSTTGKYYLHSGGVASKALKPKEIIEESEPIA